MVLIHILIFLGSIGVMWIASGLVIAGIERFAEDIRTSAFNVSVLVLGLLTSITEFSVGLNSVIKKTPAIFVGNLLGGSFVILVLIIPLLALANRGVKLKHYLEPTRLAFFLILLIAPVIVVYNGTVSVVEAVILLILYGTFIYSMPRVKESKAEIQHAKKSRHSLLADSIKIILGVILLFTISKLLINEVVYFADALHVPTFLVSLLILSIGTNFPELFIAFKAIKERRAEIALGDYIGSAACNVLLFGVFTIMHGTFSLEMTGFTALALIMIVGYVLFFFLGRSHKTLTPREGLVLMAVFVAFVIFQASEIILLSNAS